MPGDKLLPCPFCGQEPLVIPLAQGRIIECQNLACPAGAAVSDGDPDRCVLRWNRRAPAVTPTREEVARVIHEGLGESWAYSNYSGDEWNQERDRLDAAADAVLALLNGESGDGR